MPSQLRQKMIKGLAVSRRKFRILKSASGSPETRSKILKVAAVSRRKFRVLKGAAAALMEKYEINKGVSVFLGNTVVRDITFFFAFVVASALALYFIPKIHVADFEITNSKLLFDAENEARKTLAQLIGGLVVLVGVALGFRRVKAAEENVRVLQEGQITERFTRAVEQLGNEDSIHIRLGGIYALERIARDSKKDHWTIMEVLTAFIRERAKKEEETGEPKEIPELPVDIQAALTVIGRRELAHEDENTPFLDLRHTDLRRADLIGTNFVGANLFGTNLFRANLFDVNLSKASLHKANLSEAILMDANLSETKLYQTRFNGATLQRVNLSRVVYLTKEQIDSAHVDEDTKLPDYL